MQIKLRAWDAKKKKYYRDLHLFMVRYIAAVIKEDGELCLITGDNVYLQPLLFTGITDKNGNEVYEGDILKYDGDKVTCDQCGHKQKIYKRDELYVIVYCVQTVSFDCLEIGGDNFMSSCVWESDMEVIGNKFEQPELLEKKTMKDNPVTKIKLTCVTRDAKTETEIRYHHISRIYKSGAYRDVAHLDDTEFTEEDALIIAETLAKKHRVEAVKD